MFHKMANHKNLIIKYIGTFLSFLFFEFIWNKKSPDYQWMKCLEFGKIDYVFVICGCICGWILIATIIWGITVCV